MMYEGDLIVIPTDTVYGLAARLHDKVALEKIFKIKGRDQSKQIPLLISNVNQLKEICVTSKFSLEVIKKYWPGELTIIFKTTPLFKEKTGEETIAIRMPKHPVALKLIDTYGVLRVTSLNRSGEKPLTSLKDIEKQFGPFVKDIYPHGTIEKSDIASTVVDLTKRKIIVLREGNIKLSELEAFKQSLK